MIARARVVLPEPDLPTTPRVSPARTATVASFTALMWPTVLRRRPRRIGNQTRRFFVSTMVGASAGAGSGVPVGSAARSIRV